MLKSLLKIWHEIQFRKEKGGLILMLIVVWGISSGQAWDVQGTGTWGTVAVQTCLPLFQMRPWAEPEVRAEELEIRLYV